MSRRRTTLRRLFFFSLLPMLTMAGSAPAESKAQQHPDARIARRQLRITRDASGDYRVVEAFALSLQTESADDSLMLAEPLPAVRLQPEAHTPMRVGGDLGPSQIRFESSTVTVTGSAPSPDFQVIITYRLPPEAGQLEVVGEWPTDELIVEIARGNVEARLGASLEATGPAGPPSRPRRRYETAEIEAGRAVIIEFPDSRVDWRTRTAVFLATLLAGSAALLLIWRRGA